MTTPDPDHEPAPQPGPQPEKQASPLIKQVLELGPLLAFLVAYLWLRDGSVTIGGTDYGGFVVAIVLFVPLQIASAVALRLITGRLSRMQLATLILVIVLGLGTVLFNDERVFKMKSTFVFGLFGVLLFIGLWRGQSWLAFVLDQALPISREGWMILTRRMAWFFLAFAAMNEVIWRNFSTDVFVMWDTFGQMGVMFVFLMGNYKLIDTHWTGPR
ncbi:inner membrane-spanning protein YciB [Pararhodobacter sp.]|uniref:inner membrane-spanning protein YciB n=1 Tax=Pararhodobacter sp. TaxID=2127056 RepID=UPI002AFF4DB3|nr:septation protein IspZ [Pararhodobacter sp.]